MRRITFLLLFALMGFNMNFAQEQSKILLIRCDDIGMSHSVNLAAKEVLKTGIPFSASIMFPCAWYQEAVDILKDNPQVTVGIHLVLNAEWKNYRWGPISGKDAVPSLVDSFGYFFPSRASLYKNNPTLADIETELRAQIERALHSGLKIEYMDYHMGTAVDKPEYRAIVEKLAKEYKLGVSRYFGEEDTDIMYAVPIPEKQDSLIKILNILPYQKNLLVCHIGEDNPELQAMIDMNSFGLKNMSKHRQAELSALISEKTQKLLKSGKFKLYNYGMLIKEVGLENMKRPEVIN